MKKLTTFLVVMLTLAAGVFFCSCGSKYKKLNIYFVGEENNVQLILDDEYYESEIAVSGEERVYLNAKTLEVKLSNIKEKYVGKLDIDAPDGVEVLNKVVDGKTLYFSIKGLYPTKGQVVVTHLGSGKNCSIDVIVDKKAVSASYNNNGIVLDIPDKNLDGSEAFNVYTIEPANLFKFDPLDATDNVAWEVDGASLDGVKLVNVKEEIANEVVTQIEVSSSCNGGTIYLKPMYTYLADYKTILTDILVPVNLTKIVNEDDVKIVTNNAIFKSPKAEKETVTVEEDGESVKKLVVDNAINLYNNALGVNFVNLELYIDETTPNLLEDKSYMNLYECSVTSSAPNQISAKIISSEVDGKIDAYIEVVALNENSNVQWIDIKFTPQNCIGDVKAFKIRQEIILTEVADYIDVKIDGETKSTNIQSQYIRQLDIDLYDHYIKNDGKGERFNFQVLKTTAHSSLKKMRIYLNEAYLRELAYDKSQDKYVVDHQGTNQYLLEFYKNNEPLYFGLSATENNAYSESFTENDNIYIKYYYNAAGVTTDKLSFRVFNYYDTSINNYSNEYYETFQRLQKYLKVDVTRSRGLKEMNWQGSYTGKGTEVGASVLSELNKEDKVLVLNNAILTYDGAVSSGEILSGKVVYGAGLTLADIEAEGVITNEELAKIKFELKVFNNQTEVTDLFDFAIYNSNKNKVRKIEVEKFNIEEFEDAENNTDKYCILIFKKSDAKIENISYQIALSQLDTGFKKLFNYEVVTNVTTKNVDVTPFNEDDILGYSGIYRAEDYKKFLFGSDSYVIPESWSGKTYIIPAGETITTSVRMGNMYGAVFVEDDSFKPYIQNIEVDTSYVDNKDAIFNTNNSIKYISNSRDSLIGQFEFDIDLTANEYGTRLNGFTNFFVKISYRLISNKYSVPIDEMFYKLTGSQVSTVDYYFFIYVPVSETKFEGDLEDINTYIYEDLPYEFKNEGEESLTISLPNKFGNTESVFAYIDYEWIIESEDKKFFDYSINAADHTIEFRLKKVADSAYNYTSKMIKVKIKQFNYEKVIGCNVIVNKVTLADNIAIRNSLNVFDNGDGYIYLKDNNLNFTFNVEQIGNPTFKGISYIVCDLAGNVANNWQVEDNGKLVIKDPDSSAVKDLKIIISSTDWVKTNIKNNLNNYNFEDLSNYFNVKYLDRLMILDVKIRDGSKNNPYLIFNAKDFEGLNIDNRDKYYEVVNDINISSLNEFKIETFGGNLSSYKSYVKLTSRPTDWTSNYTNYYSYSKADGFEKLTDAAAPTFMSGRYYKLIQNTRTIYGISLSNNNSCLFVSNEGTISNLNFSYLVAGTIEKDKIGLIETNKGNLVNVKVEYNGEIVIKNKSEVLIGMLVAVNEGTINYTSSLTAYSVGNINLKTETENLVYLGGLVGKNNGNLFGCYNSSSLNGVEYALYYENQGSLFDGTITYNGENKNVYIGGVVGNNIGFINNVYTSGKILGNNNLGGIVGANSGYIGYYDAASTEGVCMSTTQIKGNNNIGGIAGVDENGKYYHTFYEVYNDLTAIDENAYAISGNENVGGLIGYSTGSISMNYCYFHSFRWSYINDSIAEYTGLPDIYGAKFVAGLIGKAENIKIENSVVDGYLKAKSLLSGFANVAEGSTVTFNYAYVQGAFIIESTKEIYRDIRIVTNTNADNGEAFSRLKNFYKYLFGREEPSGDNKLLTTVISTDKPPFAQNVNINNGRDYLLYNGNPLITQAPTKIGLDGSLINIDGRTKTEFLTSTYDGESVKINKTILMYYYNLINNNQSNYSYDKAMINRIYLDDFINKSNIVLEPSGIGARIRVTSNNPEIIRVNSAGYIELLKEGICSLTFASVINPTVYDAITIIVKAMPSDYNIYKNSIFNKDNYLNDGLLNIVKDESRFVYENYVGSIIFNGTQYLYTTTNDVVTNIEIPNRDSASKITINGKEYDATVQYHDFFNKEPIIITVEEFSETNYRVTMTSYIYFSVDGINKYYVKVEQRKWTLVTKKGITSINSNITDAVVSVADELPVKLDVVTDSGDDIINIKIDIKDEFGNKIKADKIKGVTIEDDFNNLFTFNGKINSYLKLTLTELDFVLKLNQEVVIEQDLFVTITFIGNSVRCELNITLIPQRITSIIGSYYKQDARDGNKWTKSLVIRPGEPGMLIIDVAPDTAYFEYLEITDLNSEEKISFIQWSSFSADILGLAGNGQALSKLDEVSLDGFGIKLKKQSSSKNIYVRTLLSSLALNTKSHKMLITAYSSSGYSLGTSVVTLEPMLFPTVILSYYNENDEIEAVSNSQSDAVLSDIELAIGVQAKIGVQTYNVDTDIDWNINYFNGSEWVNADKLDIVLSENGFYYLTYLKGFEDYKGKTIKITATVSKTTNGFTETRSTNINFKFMEFTLNGVSAITDRISANNKLGGVVGEKTKLEFYFNNIQNKNISKYENGNYFNSNDYVDFEDISENVINNLLKGINNFEKNDNVSLKLLRNSDKSIVVDFDEVLESKEDYIFSVKDVDILQLVKVENKVANIIAYTNSINNYSFMLEVKYHYNSDGQAILGEDPVEGIYLVLTSLYEINFTSYSTAHDYLPINNSEDFNNMVAGGYYILMKDIELESYDMLDIQLGGFDGNGNTITVKSFNYESLSLIANGTIGYLGLFKEIYKNSIIENLIVKYMYDKNINLDLSYYTAKENTDYSSFYFGGIAPINNGIITNCMVEGSVNLSATKISPSKFYLGGICAENKTGAYITNSTVSAIIQAGGIIGGLATNNYAKIVSSKFIGGIFGYTSVNTSLSNEINVASIVVNNDGEISMCYAAKEIDDAEGFIGTVASGGSLGGFVFNNNGKVTDCYLKDLTFLSRGYLGGFVYNSTGTITRCYINTSSALPGDRYVDIFVYNKKSGIFEDCYFVLADEINSSVKGISCILKTQINLEEKFNNYGFSFDGHSVWTMTPTGPAISVCGFTKYSKEITEKIENGVKKLIYSISGTKENPFIIYNLEQYQYWMNKTIIDNVIYGYFRIVADIDFSSLNGLPFSSTHTFAGSLEGNNMKLIGFSIYSEDNLEQKNQSIGLFKEIKQVTSNEFVNNLTLICGDVRASSVNAVGVLAGIIDGGAIYNITIDAEGSVVMGKNAVGGLAGIIKGQFVVQNITSNISVNSVNRKLSTSKLDIYNGNENYKTANYSNLKDVSYAGAIAGIVEAYDSRLIVGNAKNLNDYYTISNCSVTGNVTVIAETAGAAFGFVNERTRLYNINVNFEDKSYLKGVYYSGGIVGENRGIVQKATVNALDNYFAMYDANLDGELASCVGGIVGVNYGGLVQDCYNNSNVVNYYILSTVGGIVGRNVEGTIVNSVNKGAVYGFFTGAITGADYSYNLVTRAGNTKGAVSNNTIKNVKTNNDYSSIVGSINKYSFNIEELDVWYNTQWERLKELNISREEFYTYTKAGLGEDISKLELNYAKILGGVIGITDKQTDETITTENTITYDGINNKFILNTNSANHKVLEDLKEFLQNNAEPKTAKFYYLVAVSGTNVAYDYYNLVSNGYTGNAIIINN